MGLQILIWLGSGLYMVVVDIDFIHGDPLVKNMRETVPDTGRFSMASLKTRYPVSNSEYIEAHVVFII